MDGTAPACNNCHLPFNVTRRKHHCRSCGRIFCQKCSQNNSLLPSELGYTKEQRVCDRCLPVLSDRREAFNAQVLDAQIFVRSDPSLAFERGAPDLGWRSPFIKAYSLLKMTTDKKPADGILVVVDSSQTPLALHSQTKSKAFEDLLNTVLPRHPFLLGGKPGAFTTTYVREKEKVMTQMEVMNRGSVRDRIHNVSKPHCHNYFQKYGASLGEGGKGAKKRGKRGKPLSVKQVSMYGRSVLEALRFLNRLKLPCLNLHAGNVLVSNENQNRCTVGPDALLSLMLGLPPRNSSMFEGYSRSEYDVVQFGYFVFEMAVGEEKSREEALGKHRRHIEDHFPDLYPLLEKIFRGSEAHWNDGDGKFVDIDETVGAMPTVDKLLDSFFFGEQVKISNKRTVEGLQACSTMKLDKYMRSLAKHVEASLESVIQHGMAYERSLLDGSINPLVSPRTAQKPSILSTSGSQSIQRRKRQTVQIAPVSSTPPKFYNRSLNNVTAMARGGANLSSSNGSTSSADAAATKNTSTQQASTPAATKPSAAPTSKSSTTTKTKKTTTKAAAAPPPAPPPGAPPAPKLDAIVPAAVAKPTSERGNLLASIRQGKKLKKVNKK